MIDKSCSLNDVEFLYEQGLVSRAEIVEYLRKWNAGPHFTQAVWWDGRIRNFDPEVSIPYQKDVMAECGVRLPPTEG